MVHQCLAAMALCMGLLDHRTTGVDGSDAETDAEEDVECHQAIGAALLEHQALLGEGGESGEAATEPHGEPPGDRRIERSGLRKGGQQPDEEATEEVDHKRPERETVYESGQREQSDAVAEDAAQHTAQSDEEYSSHYIF